MNELLTVREVQEILKIDRITIYRMIQDGRLQGTKVGQQWRFTRQDIERLVGSKRPSTQVPPSTDSGLPVHCIQTIQDLFSDVSEVSSLYVDSDGVPVTQISHPCRFCQAILASPTGRLACQSSWHDYIQNSHRSYVTCHAGLQYIGASVNYKSEEIGLFISGQFYLQAPDPVEELARLQRLATEHQIPLETLRQTAAGIRVIEPEERGTLESWPFSAARAILSILRERAGFLNRLQQIAELTRIP